MLYYQNRSFCNFTNCGKFDNCDRAFTEKVKKEAEIWWLNCYLSSKEKHPPVMLLNELPRCFV